MARKEEPGSARTLIPLEIKLATKKGPVDLKGKGVARREVHEEKDIRTKEDDGRESSSDMWQEFTTVV